MYRDSRYLLDISYNLQKISSPVCHFKEPQAGMWRYGLRGLVDLGGLSGAKHGNRWVYLLKMAIEIVDLPIKNGDFP